MRSQNLKTKIFIDSGDPAETKQAIELLGFLDGQTTNPSLIAKHPKAAARMARGEKFTSEEIYGFYKEVVGELSKMMPGGSISIEVYADGLTTAEQMFAQGQEMFGWIPNAHIKFPTTAAGLEAAERAIKEGMRVNMTLCFSQAQAVAVYAATRGAKKGAVFVSPFVGRLDDRGENGMGLIANIIKMYRGGEGGAAGGYTSSAGSGNGSAAGQTSVAGRASDGRAFGDHAPDGHVEVLTASVRTMEHFLYALALGSDIITAPFKILKEWGDRKMPVPGADFKYNAGELKPIPYQQLDLNKDWRSFDLRHDLTDKGIERFAQDWNNLIR